MFQLPKKSWKVAPRTACPNDPQHRFDKAPVVAPASAGVRRLAQTMRFHLRPLRVGQYKSFHPKLESQPAIRWNPESQQALVQDAAYGTLLREPKRALHARIAETLESDFSDIAENQPEILARHCTEAGVIEKAAGLWGKAGQRSLERSALVEAAEQLSRALDQIATLPATPALRKEQIRLQVALIHPLFQIRGFAAPETKAAAEQARLLIEKAEALSEPLEDPLLLFSVLFGFWVANYLAFNGDVMRDLATQFLTLAKRQETKIPQMMGHQVMGISLAATGDLVQGLPHFDRGVARYDPEQHRPLATRFGADVRVSNVSFRSWAQWMRGYPEAALADAKQALREARDISQAATLLFALFWTSLIEIFCGKLRDGNERNTMNLSLWRTKKAPFTGRRIAHRCKVVFLP